MEHRYENDCLTVQLRGRVDSTNAPELERELTELRQSKAPKRVVLDCGNLDYISSAGLRVVLRMKKAVPDTVVTEAAPQVYEVFEVTGFSELMEVHKALRRLSVADCEVMGEGANGVVYRIGPEMVVKVYRNPDALPEIEKERELAKKAFVLGVPTAIPYDVVRIREGGYGSVFELVNAASFAQLLQRGEKTVEEIAQMSVELLRIIHGIQVEPETVPSMRKLAMWWTEALEGQLEGPLLVRLRELISQVPDENRLLHGDYHIKNITWLQDGESLVLDMDTLSRGNPVFELAAMYNAYCGFGETDHNVSVAFLGLPYEASTQLWKRSLELYLEGADEAAIRAAEDKIMVVSYTRIMSRRIRHEGLGTAAARLQVDNCRRHLVELLPRVESLAL
ncbi:MAG: anti-sigma factor antagonist [Oscillospiraceae bacterium]|nr:anti-sigma factor antagonist [Oscillospiraceae bacterium]